MKNTMWRSAIAGVILATGSVPLSAQVVVSKPVRFGIAGGATVPVSDISDFSKTGWHAGALVEAGVPLFPWGLRIDAMWNQLGKKETDIGTVKNRIIDGTVNAAYSFGGLSTTKFYLIGGLGIYNRRFSSDLTNDANSKTSAGVNVGGGIRFPLGGLTTFLEARYHVMLGNQDEATNLQFIPISFGVQF